MTREDIRRWGWAIGTTAQIAIMIGGYLIFVERRFAAIEQNTAVASKDRDLAIIAAVNGLKDSVTVKLNLLDIEDATVKGRIQAIEDDIDELQQRDGR